MDKKISVIVTIYNTPEKYLKQCIESIKNQTLKEIEIILVDDGSTKNIRKICEEYSKKDKRIKLIKQQNKGVSAARNTGIKNATSQNIMFVDSDDWIEYNTCEMTYLYIKKIKKYDILIFNCFIDYKNKSKKNKFYLKNGLLEKEDIEQIQLQNIEKGISEYYPPYANISSVWSKVYNKDFIEKNILRFTNNIIRMEDAIFNMYAFEKAIKIHVLNEYLYHYRKNKFSISQKYSENTILYYETYFDFVNKYIEEYNKNKKFIDILNIKIVTSIDKYMYNYFFNQKNLKSKKEIRKEFLELLDKQIYRNAMNKVKKSYLSKYQQAILMFAKNKNYTGLRILRKIKDMIKSNS